MEEVDQAYGYILYRTTLHGPVGGLLHSDQLHGYARIYLDGKLAGTLDHRLWQSDLAIHSAAASAQLDILVENSGRVNYGKALARGRAGISQQVLLAGQPLTGWEIFPLPMQNTAVLPFRTLPCTGPCFYRAELQLDGQPADAFLDTRALGKGFVWVNGHALGRVWNIAPQRTLYLPASCAPVSLPCGSALRIVTIKKTNHEPASKMTAYWPSTSIRAGLAGTLAFNQGLESQGDQC